MLNPLSLIPTPYLLIGCAVAAAVVVGGAYVRGHSDGVDKVQAAWNTDKLAIGKQTLRIIETNTVKQQTLQDAADKLRSAKNAQIQKLNTDLAAAVERLRDRPERPASGDSLSPVASTGATATGATGAQLYRPDAEFLVRESARADQLRAALAECYAAYGSAREAVNGPN